MNTNSTELTHSLQLPSQSYLLHAFSVNFFPFFYEKMCFQIIYCQVSASGWNDTYAI